MSQLVCHIPNNDVICTKLGILQTMRDFYCRTAPGSSKRIATPWVPETYQLDSPADVSAALQVSGNRLPILLHLDPLGYSSYACTLRPLALLRALVSFLV